MATLTRKNVDKRIKFEWSTLEGIGNTIRQLGEMGANGQLAPDQANVGLKAAHGYMYVNFKLPMELNLLLLRFKGRLPIGIPLLGIKGEGVKALLASPEEPSAGA